MVSTLRCTVPGNIFFTALQSVKMISPFSMVWTVPLLWSLLEIGQSGLFSCWVAVFWLLGASQTKNFCPQQSALLRFLNGGVLRNLNIYCLVPPPYIAEIVSSVRHLGLELTVLCPPPVQAAWLVALTYTLLQKKRSMESCVSFWEECR